MALGHRNVAGSHRYGVGPAVTSMALGHAEMALGRWSGLTDLTSTRAILGRIAESSSLQHRSNADSTPIQRQTQRHHGIGVA